MEAIQTKLVQLNIAVGKTDAMLESESEGVFDRHLSAVKALASEADQIKRELEGLKIAAKEEIEVIQEWNGEVEANISTADSAIKRVKTALGEYREEKSSEKQERELQFEKKLFEAKLKYQAELQFAKEEQESMAQAKSVGKVSSSGEVQAGQTAKLPKLHIARFEGTYEDWPRFWSQFVEMIDKTAMGRNA